MKYIAFLRGIGPGSPSMQNSKLRSVFEDIGFSRVQSVISSGNIIFESDRTDAKAMEAELEAAWPKKLGFTSTTIIRTQQQLAEVIANSPFTGMTHGPSSYLLITYFKQPTEVNFEFPYQPEGKTYKLLAADKNTVYTTTDNTQVKTTDLMTWLEKQFGKEISSRTFLTTQRILARMQPKQPL